MFGNLHSFTLSDYSEKNRFSPRVGKDFQLSTFGIKAFMRSDTPSFYVGEDERLWDWLVADNGVPVGQTGLLVVPPPGSEFQTNPLDDEYKLKVEGLHINVNSVSRDKVVQVLDALNFVEDIAEFEALNIDESRLVTVSI
jgi:hypothetical protein